MMHEKYLVKNLETENFLVSIGWESIEYQSREAEPRLEKSRNFWLIENHTRSIKILENWIFLKIVEVLCRKHSDQIISWMNYMRMSLIVFQNICFQPRTSKTRFSIIKDTIFANS